MLQWQFGAFFPAGVRWGLLGAMSRSRGAAIDLLFGSSLVQNSNAAACSLPPSTLMLGARGGGIFLSFFPPFPLISMRGGRTARRSQGLGRKHMSLEVPFYVGCFFFSPSRQKGKQAEKLCCFCESPTRAAIRLLHTGCQQPCGALPAPCPACWSQHSAWLQGAARARAQQSAAQSSF